MQRRIKLENTQDILYRSCRLGTIESKGRIGAQLHQTILEVCIRYWYDDNEDIGNWDAHAVARVKPMNMGAMSASKAVVMA